jgi:hypothetical protein
MVPSFLLKRDSDEQCFEELYQCKQELENKEIDLGKDWKVYRNYEHRFSLKFPARADDIEYEEFIDSSDFVHEQYSFGLNVYLEITDKPISEEEALPTNYVEGEESQDVFLEKFVKIPAKKYVGYLPGAGNPKFAGYLIFKRNRMTYILRYFSYSEGNNREVFETLISSLQLDGGYLIERGELEYSNGAYSYEDDFYNLSISVPQGWSVWRGLGDNADGPIIELTTIPIDKKFSNIHKAKPELFNHIYIGHRLIFSTSGALCANTTCEDAGGFSVDILGKRYSTKVLDHPYGGYRLSFELDGIKVPSPFGSSSERTYSPYVTVSVKKFPDLESVRRILSSIDSL